MKGTDTMKQNNAKMMAAHAHKPSKQLMVAGPDDPERQREDAKLVYISGLGANVFGGMTDWTIKDETKQAAEAFMGALKESIKPRDVVEEMLLVQMAWTHSRLARLSAVAIDQAQTQNVRVVNEAADRAANTFRRQMLALAEYRKPPRSEAFVAIKQANVAAQQVVQNLENQNQKNEITSNEQGSARPTNLPPVVEGVDVPEGRGGDEPPMAVEHRPDDPGRQAAVEDECDETRQP